jgi:hypothetical protein
MQLLTAKAAFRHLTKIERKAALSLFIPDDDQLDHITAFSPLRQCK